VTSTETRTGGFNLADEMPDDDLTLSGLGEYGIDEGTTITEPSDGRLAEFRKALYVASRPSAKPIDVDNLSEDEIIDALVSRDWSAGGRKECDAFAVLCGATPPEDDQGVRRPRPIRPDDPPKPLRDTYDNDAAHAKALQKWQTDLTKHEKAVGKYEDDLAAWEQKWVGGTPTRQQLAALPPRVRNKLFGYLAGLFLDPTPPGTSADTSG
jgi:hypothetical protein